jgi:signal peptidase I
VLKNTGSFQTEERHERESGKKEKGGEMFDWLQSIVSTLVVCILLFVFVGRTIGVNGSSMRQTLEEGDRLVISNLFYTPKYGDIVVLRKESFADYPIVKRVIATEGRTVDIDFTAGVVSVDGVPLDEPYTNTPTNEPEDFTGPVTVPEGCVFVMGDNRNRSTDSRTNTIGCVDTRYIIGKALLRITPISRFGGLY